MPIGYYLSFFHQFLRQLPPIIISILSWKSTFRRIYVNLLLILQSRFHRFGCVSNRYAHCLAPEKLWGNHETYELNFSSTG